MKIILSLLLIGNIAQASIEGEWNGWAYWKYDGDGPKCTARMNFQETMQEFAVLPGLLDCDLVTMDIPSKFLKKDPNGDLIYAKEVVGKWSENTFSWTERYNERTVINISIQVNGTNLDYKEHWIQDNNKLLYDISGRLFKYQ